MAPWRLDCCRGTQRLLLRTGKQILSQADPLYTMMRGAEVSMLPCFTRALPRPRHLQFISHHSRVHRK